MGKDILNLVNSFFSLFEELGPVGSTILVIGILFLLYCLYAGLTKDVNYNPDHWSHKGDVHNWSPSDD